MKRTLHISGVKGSAMSGAETVLLDLVDCLSEHGYESVVVVGGPGRFASLLESRGICHVYADVMALFPQQFTPILAMKFLVHLFRASLQLVRKVKNCRTQLIVTHTRVGHLYGRLTGWLTGVPVVMYYHDLSRSRISRLVKVCLALNATKVIAISQAVKEDLMIISLFRRWIGQKTTVIPNAVDLQRFHPKIDGYGITSEFGLETAFPIVGLIGQLVEWKGHVDFIKAAAMVASVFPAARFLLVGSAAFGNLDYEKHLRELVTTLGLDNHVIFTGHRTDVPELIAALDILVSASWAEPFGLPASQ
jgi:glycosyltransferase involved in cell wall biosynthesis